MKKVFSILIALLFITVVSVPQSSAQSRFSDTQNTRYEESIEYVAQKNAIKGYPDGTFRPQVIVNRAEMVTILVTAQVEESLIGNRGNCFKDVHDEWYARYICYAKEKKLVKGYPDNTFKPGQQVNMVEAYALAMKHFDFAVPEDPFAAEKNSQWYTPYMQFAHTNTPFSKFAYLPNRGMKRDEVAALLHNFFMLKDGSKEISLKRDNHSLGCGKNQPTVPPSSFMLNGVERSFITAVPGSYDQDKALPLVYAFHGRTNSNAEVRRYYGVEQAAQGKAIFVYPAGIKNGTMYSWSDAGDSADAQRDFAFFDKLVKEFSAKYCVDLDRIFVVGHSLGGWFVNTLACARGDVIRAIGTVGGGTTTGNCSGPTAALIMHNPKDNLVPFSQGLRARDQLIAQNQCGAGTTPVEPLSLNCKAYSCLDGAPFRWCEHREDTAYWDGSYYPHTWPRSAGREIWKFFTSIPD